MSEKKSKDVRKKEIRSLYLTKRNQMEPEQRKEASKKIREWVYANKRFKLAQTVFVYASSYNCVGKIVSGLAATAFAYFLFKNKK